MGFLSFLSSGLVDSVGKVADNLFTSDEERMEKKNESQKTRLQHDVEMKQLDLGYESELTKRLQSDNQGNFLTKSARPITLYLMLSLIMIMVFGNMFGIEIDKKYLDLVQLLALTVFSFYFGGKSIEAYKHGRVL